MYGKATLPPPHSTGGCASNAAYDAFKCGCLWSMAAIDAFKCVQNDAFGS